MFSPLHDSARDSSVGGEFPEIQKSAKSGLKRVLSEKGWQQKQLCKKQLEST